MISECEGLDVLYPTHVAYRSWPPACNFTLPWLELLTSKLKLVKEVYIMNYLFGFLLSSMHFLCSILCFKCSIPFVFVCVVPGSCVRSSFK